MRRKVFGETANDGFAFAVKRGFGVNNRREAARRCGLQRDVDARQHVRGGGDIGDVMGLRIVAIHEPNRACVAISDYEHQTFLDAIAQEFRLPRRVPARFVDRIEERKRDGGGGIETQDDRSGKGKRRYHAK